jgi:threonine/homoserine/homoserine lactone efflux protein
MAVGSIAAFWAVALLLISVPGADWAFTIGSSLRGHSAVAAVSGLVLGYALVTVVVAAGVGALVAGTPAALSALTIVGGLYLIWHGARTFTDRAAADPTPAGSVPRTNRAVLVKGVGVSALNPKGLLLFLALLPQFTNPRWSLPVGVQLGVLGVVFMASCAVFYLCLGSLAGKILHARPGAARVVTRLSAVAMIVIGVLLLADRLMA